MSHNRVKTKYNVSGAYGSIEQRTLLADHNNSCDVVSFYWDDGELMFQVEDTLDNNLADAIERLMPGISLIDGVEVMSLSDMDMCKNYTGNNLLTHIKNDAEHVYKNLPADVCNGDDSALIAIGRAVAIRLGYLTE